MSSKVTDEALDRAVDRAAAAWNAEIRISDLHVPDPASGYSCPDCAPVFRSMIEAALLSFAGEDE
jgi:hypothetical protein